MPRTTCCAPIARATCMGRLVRALESGSIGPRSSGPQSLISSCARKPARISLGGCGMGKRLRGKRALIYGGGTGIGLACAEAMAAEGALVFVSSRREQVLKEAVAKLAGRGKADFAPGDATSAADVQRVTAAAAKSMG